jgi:membrane protein implicated in regulation of membrane protease activity
MTLPRSARTNPRVEGGGPAGCGCGFILGVAAGLMLFLRMGDIGWLFAFVFAAAIAGISWVFGDRFLEKVLHGNEDGKPMRLWPF